MNLDPWTFVTCETACPACSADVGIVPDQFDGVRPVSGICPNCNARIEIGQTYLSGFEPELMTEGDPGSVSLTVEREDK
jgi:hypothetical protein